MSVVLVVGGSRSEDVGVGLGQEDVQIPRVKAQRPTPQSVFLTRYGRRARTRAGECRLSR